MPMVLDSPAFPEGGHIPVEYTCDGNDISPPLEWHDIPQGARSLVVIVDDPDAPDPQAPRTTWVHWVVYNLPPETTGLPAGVRSVDLPAGTAEGVNDWKRIGYGGPCPPIGRHRYLHKLYALDTQLQGMNRPTKATVEAAMQGHILAESVLMGTYQKLR